MAKFNFLQNALTGGEVTPLAKGRTDYPQYRNSLEDCKNMIPYVVGGAKRRAGTNYFMSANTGDLNLGSAVDAFIPWEVSSGGRYIVAIGGSDFSRVINVNTGTSYVLSVAVDTESLTTSTFNIANVKYTTTQAQQAQYCQVGDILYIVCHGHAPLILKFSAGTSSADGDPGAFVFNANVLSTGFKGSPGSNSLAYQRMPYRPVNLTATTISSSATALGATTLTASASLFNAGHVNTYFKLQQGAVFVTGYNSATEVTGTIVDVLSSGAATASWEEGAWSDYRGWPRTVGFFENRLVYGGNTSQPDTLWFAQDGDVCEWSAVIGAAASDTDGFGATPNNAEKVAKINWMITGKNFAFGTEKEEFTITRPDVQAGFSISNIQISHQTSRGSKYLQALRVESAAYFVDSGGQRIVEFVFDERENSFRNRDLNIFADHMFAKFQELHSSPRSEKRIIRLAKQSDSDQKIWVLDEAGGLFSCALDRILNVEAWSMHYLGGNGSGDDLDPAPFVRSMCSMDNTGLPTTALEGHDVLWLSTGRSINNSFLNHVEYIDRPSEDEDDYLDYKLPATVSGIGAKFTYVQPAFAGSAQADYMYFTAPNRTYAVWFDKDAAGTAPTGAIYTAASVKIEVDIVTGDTASQVAGKVVTALMANVTFATTDGLTATRPNTDEKVTITFPSYVSPVVGTKNANDSGAGSITAYSTYATWDPTNPQASAYVREPREPKSITITGGTAVSGLNWLKNETVSVVADGNYVGDKAVSSTGTFTLSLSASEVIVGFKYKSRIKTLPLEAGSQIGSALGSIGRIDQARIHFYRSANANVGGSEQDDDSNLDEIIFRPSSVASSLPIPLFSGYKVIDLAHDYERGAQVVVETDGPLAMTITHITLRGQTYD